LITSLYPHSNPYTSFQASLSGWVCGTVSAVLLLAAVVAANTRHTPDIPSENVPDIPSENVPDIPSENVPDNTAVDLSNSTSTESSADTSNKSSGSATFCRPGAIYTHRPHRVRPATRPNCGFATAHRPTSSAPLQGMSPSPISSPPAPLRGLDTIATSLPLR
jgi:hypothetical protein